MPRCDNEIETETPDSITYESCPGHLAFRPEDHDAPCDTCGARCGSLVADYIDPQGPWPDAILRWHRDVAKAWQADHRAGHPRGRGNCPIRGA